MNIDYDVMAFDFDLLCATRLMFYDESKQAESSNVFLRALGAAFGVGGDSAPQAVEGARDPLEW